MSTNSQDKVKKRKYRVPYKRPETHSAMELRDREEEVLKMLHLLRFMNIDQIQALCFAQTDNPSESKVPSRRRMRKMYDAALVERIEKKILFYRGDYPYLYSLDKNGVEYLASHILKVDVGSLLWKPHHNQVQGRDLQHYEDTADLWVMLHKLHRYGHIRLERWHTELQFKSKPFQHMLPFRHRGARVERKEPDGFFTLSTPNSKAPFSFFFEIDEGTEAHKVFAEKLKVYNTYRLSGGSKEYYGTQNWRLLTLTSSPERLKELMKTAQKEGCGDYCWFSLIEHLGIWNPAKVLEPIWQVIGMDGMQSLV